MNQFSTPFASLLDPGEKLLWSGQPKQGVRLQGSDIFLIPFSLMWGGFAFFWEATVLGLTGMATHPRTQAGSAGGISLFMALWGIPFMAIGLYMILGRFFFDAASRKRTWYALTDRRLIVLKSLFNRSVNSFDYATLTNLNLVERADQSGDILFGTPSPMAAFSNASWPRSNRYPAVPGFYLLPSARQVFNQVREAQQRARNG